jgi:hypothetical protein
LIRLPGQPDPPSDIQNVTIIGELPHIVGGK